MLDWLRAVLTALLALHTLLCACVYNSSAPLIMPFSPKVPVPQPLTNPFWCYSCSWGLFICFLKCIALSYFFKKKSSIKIIARRWERRSMTCNLYFNRETKISCFYFWFSLEDGFKALSWQLLQPCTKGRTAGENSHSPKISIKWARKISFTAGRFNETQKQIGQGGSYDAFWNIIENRISKYKRRPINVEFKPPGWEANLIKR